MAVGTAVKERVDRQVRQLALEASRTASHPRFSPKAGVERWVAGDRRHHGQDKHLCHRHGPGFPAFASEIHCHSVFSSNHLRSKEQTRMLRRTKAAPTSPPTQPMRRNKGYSQQALETKLKAKG